MKKLTSKLFAVVFIGSMIVVLRNTTKLLTKALAVRHGLKVSRRVRRNLALNLISMATVRWTMELIAGGDARLEKRLAKLDKKLYWAREAFGLLMVEVEDHGRFIGAPEGFFGNSWWDFIKKDHEYSDAVFELLVDGPRRLKTIGVGWYFWEMFGNQAIPEMERRLEYEEHRAYEEFLKHDESSVWENAH